jgi:hypothetical protein
MKLRTAILLVLSFLTGTILMFWKDDTDSRNTVDTNSYNQGYRQGREDEEKAVESLLDQREHEERKQMVNRIWGI